METKNDQHYTIIPTLRDAGEVWEGTETAVKELEVTQMRAAKGVLGYSQRTSDAAVVRAELDTHSMRTGRDVSNLKEQPVAGNERNETAKNHRKSRVESSQEG